MMIQKKILVVDDEPVQRRLLALQLSRLGFEVFTAEDGTDALEKAKEFRPDAIVSDVVMRQLDGYQLCEVLKSNPELSQIPVVLTTSGFVGEDDKLLARQKGACTLVQRVPGFRDIIGALHHSLEQGPSAEETGKQKLFSSIRDSFLRESEGQAQRLLERLNSGLDVSGARSIAHRWAGIGGALGFPHIRRLAHEIEKLLSKTDPEAKGVLRRNVIEILELFSDDDLKTSELTGVPSGVLMSIKGKRLAVLGMEPESVGPLVKTLEQAAVSASIVERSEWRTTRWDRFDLVLVGLHGHSGKAPANDVQTLDGIGKPILFIGPREAMNDVMSLELRGHDFLVSPWSPEELVIRLSRVMDRAAPAPVDDIREEVASGSAQVVVADDDPTTLALVEATLLKYKLRCHTASNGEEALSVIRRLSPDLVVLDVDMPACDGFEVLASLRNDATTRDVRVVMLTSRQQEIDIVRGFGLGADDYVVKPFSPMELIARIKRLLRR